MSTRSRLLTWLILSSLLPLAAHSASGSVREAEIAQCRPGEISTWGDGVDRAAVASPLVFVYQHQGAPTWFTEAQVRRAIEAAAVGWAPCGVPTRVAVDSTMEPGAVLIQWNEQGSARNFGLANVGARTLSLGPAAFELLRTRNPKHPAIETLQMVLAHEMGHLYGLMAHSRRCVDVMSYYNNGKGQTCQIRGGGSLPLVGEYRSGLPTSCDLQRCRAANRGAYP